VAIIGRSVVRCATTGAALGLALLASGCARSSAPGADGTVTVGGSEIPASIKLTPQTIVIRDGRRAVKSISEDGATITLDASSPGAADIKSGSIVLIRDVEVVKAAAVRREGSQVVITAAPAAITELIQNGEIRWNAVKIDFRKGAIHTLPAAASTSARVNPWRQLKQPQVLALALPGLASEDDGDRFAGKIKDFDYDAGYTRADDRMSADGHVHGETHGVKVDINVKGHISSFEFGGRIAIKEGKADNLNLLLDKLQGEVDLQASASRAAGASHAGEQLLDIPKVYDFPIVIDGIPFVLTFKFALLLNEGITNVGGSASVGANLKLHGSQGAEWRLPGEPKAEPTPKAEGDMALDFDVTRSEGVGIGPQALLVAVQYPWLGLGLGFGAAHAGPFIDVVTAASTTVSGAAAIIPCKRAMVVISGSVGLEAQFLYVIKRSIRATVYQKTIRKLNPNIKACESD
jgi:hypothetical protein